ncbi:MAG: LysR family transcriptional regulator [Pseudohongiellaceae bacterium]
MPTTTLNVKVPVRLMLDDNIAIGPGKAELLAAVKATGSISSAARQMGMSYRRAWMLVETMNACFARPLVATSTGGRAGGGALLTEEGEAVLSAYTDMHREVLQVATQHMQKLLKQAPLRPSQETDDSSV